MDILPEPLRRDRHPRDPQRDDLIEHRTATLQCARERRLEAKADALKAPSRTGDGGRPHDRNGNSFIAFLIFLFQVLFCNSLLFGIEILCLSKRIFFGIAMVDGVVFERAIRGHGREVDEPLHARLA